MIVARGREPEELPANPGRWKALAKRLGAGDVTELVGYDRTGVLVARISPDSTGGTIPAAASTPPSPAGRTAPQDAAPRNSTAGLGGIDPEAQRFDAFVRGQQVILSQFQAMLDPIFRGFTGVTESLALRVSQLEAQSQTPLVEYVEREEEPKSQVDELAGQVLAGVASSMGIAPGGTK